MVIENEAAKMVLTKITKVGGSFGLRKRKIRGVRNRENSSNLDMMIPLYVINVARGTLVNARSGRRCATNVNSQDTLLDSV